MAPTIVLMFSFLLLLARARLRGVTDTATAGARALAIMFAFTGVSHFIFTANMTAMVPPALPWAEAWVYLTGIAEIGLAVALWTRTWRTCAGMVAIVLLACLLPANIHAAAQRVGMGGHRDGLEYLWFRIPLQLGFGLWAYGFAVRPRSHFRAR